MNCSLTQAGISSLTGKEANVAFEVYMPAYIATLLVVHTWVSYASYHCLHTSFVAFEVCIFIYSLNFISESLIDHSSDPSLFGKNTFMNAI